ncbi:hypothetical protein BDN72DRAFT_866297, partial [Pluteus cervinus]
ISSWECPMVNHMLAMKVTDETSHIGLFFKKFTESSPHRQHRWVTHKVPQAADTEPDITRTKYLERERIESLVNTLLRSGKALAAFTIELFKARRSYPPAIDRSGYTKGFDLAASFVKSHGIDGEVQQAATVATQLTNASQPPHPQAVNTTLTRPLTGFESPHPYHDLLGGDNWASRTWPVYKDAYKSVGLATGSAANALPVLCLLWRSDWSITPSFISHKSRDGWHVIGSAVAQTFQDELEENQRLKGLTEWGAFNIRMALQLALFPFVKVEEKETVIGFQRRWDWADDVDVYSGNLFTNEPDHDDIAASLKIALAVQDAHGQITRALNTLTSCKAISREGFIPEPMHRLLAPLRNAMARQGYLNVIHKFEPGIEEVDARDIPFLDWPIPRPCSPVINIKYPTAKDALDVSKSGDVSKDVEMGDVGEEGKSARDEKSMVGKAVMNGSENGGNGIEKGPGSK